MFKIEIIESEDHRWVEIIQRTKVYDFYHTAIYHRLDNSDVSKLFYISDGINFIALPIVIRPIEGSDLFDFTSVYGYPGPLFNVDYSELSEELIIGFVTEFKRFCLSEKLVSGFMRLHPLLQQQELMQKLGTIIDLNKTIAIDLMLPSEDQRKLYRKSLKSELNQLRRKGFTVEVAQNQEEIDAFIAIYYETMDRVEATKSYYFGRDYFMKFLGNNEFSTSLLVAKFEGEITAGAIFTATAGIMQYHLAGTKEAFIKDTPMKLILDEARLLGNEKGYTHLHLGGGVGGSDDDSLFRFKSGFSKNLQQFSIWKAIIDENNYQALVEQRDIDSNSSNFFPLYRLIK